MTTNQMLYERMVKSFVTDENCSEGIDNNISNGISYSKSIHGSDGISYSQGIIYSQGIHGSDNIGNSRGINYSDSISSSSGISHSNDINNSNGIRSGREISDSNGIRSSNNISDSNGISYSQGISHSKGINYSDSISYSSGVENSFFCKNLRGAADCILCYGLQGACSMIFNKKVDKERFGKIKGKLLDFGWKPDFTTASKLREEAGGDWAKTPAAEIKGRTEKEAYSEMPKAMIDYIKSLPEYDPEIFKAITGLEE